MPINICVAGATGWAGSAVTRHILQSGDFQLAGVIARRSVGLDIGEVLGGPPAGIPIVASLEEVLLRQALGEDVERVTREATAAGVMMIPIPRRGIYRRVTGLEAAAGGDGVEEGRVTAKPDTLLLPLPEGRSYLGFIFARGSEAADVERALREGHAALDFVVEREVQIL